MAIGTSPGKIGRRQGYWPMYIAPQHVDSNVIISKAYREKNS